MATTGTMDLPVYVRIGGKEVELGTLTLDLKVSSGGKVCPPKPSEIKRALRKGLR